MTLNQFLFETGPEGTSLTNGNSGSVAASIGTGSSTAFAAAYKAHGTYGARFTNGAAANCYRRWPLASASTSWRVKVPIILPTSPPASNLIIASAANSGGAGRLQLTVTTAGAVQISDVGAAHTYVLATAGQVSWGGQYLWAVQAVGGSTTASTINSKLYLQSSGAQVGSSVAATNANMGTDAVVGIDLGICNTQAASLTVGIDTLLIEDTGGAELASYVDSNSAPSVTVGPNQNVAPGATVTLSSTVSDSDGTIASRLWTFVYPSSGAPTLSDATAAAPTFTAGSAGALYVLKHTATDDDGATAEATMEVRVPLGSGVAVRPLAGYTASGSGTWTNTGGAASEGAALADESNTTFVESGTISGTPQTRRHRLQPCIARTDESFSVTLSTDTGTTTATVRLYEGATVRQTWTQLVNSTPTAYSFAVDSGTIAATSDWGNRYWEEQANS